jgi:hypothetical protein
MIYNINMSQSKKSVLGTLRRTAIHALGGEERKPRPAVTHARVDRIEPRIKPSRPYGPGSLPPSMIKPSFHHRRDRGGSGNRIQGLSDVAGSRQRDLRTRASNETSGIGQHLGKSTAHSQVIQAVNAEHGQTTGELLFYRLWEVILQRLIIVILVVRFLELIKYHPLMRGV